MHYTTIQVTDAAGIRTITLCRPERRNALTPKMRSELTSALDDTISAGVGALVLTGAGDAFCSGLDLSELQSMHDRTAAEHRADAEGISHLFRTLYELPLPTIAVVRGAAIAGGAGLAMICDFTLATPAALFGFTEARIGFVPALVSAFLALQLGDKRTRDLLLTARTLNADEAHALGLVSEIVPQERLELRVQELTRSLLANSRQSLSSIKKLMAAQNKAWLDTSIALAMDANAQARETEDFREGVAAFLQKRKPRWARADER